MKPSKNARSAAEEAGIDMTRVLFVDGVLYLVSEGDPLIDGEALAALAAQVNVPVGEIQRIVVDDSAFSPGPSPLKNLPPRAPKARVSPFDRARKNLQREYEVLRNKCLTQIDHLSQNDGRAGDLAPIMMQMAAVAQAAQRYTIHLVDEENKK